MTRAFLRTTIFLASALICGAFVVPRQTSTAPFATTAPGGGDRPTAAYAKKKYSDSDFDDISSRDMTREEMLALNKKNEEIMNAELGAMTGFSVIISIPIFYLCWVAFFSE
eukprot:CAMPEP_0113302184 /NCGR_PEP_ID=MMETSP0010_2-20120614/3102_1 /TAXON_ID=216773 ORGANISM="Corethron hystrix, Strain 308" /NCGR_SAMPLE_ID=MMETSP0010_2 /ASSEMBLY_ACC=CAM_ASM_000155 /LENGTH=110 /DNA_ID=CAMNT_0000155931 /DNA_START=46 /DNA_END=378 /DNA_ORIENTATION=- /assembly_acc=CAM_ASM_000155